MNLSAFDNPNDLVAVHQQLRDQLFDRHGPMLGGMALVVALGFNNLAAFRQAKRRGHVAVTLFTLPNRRGHFALTLDVADWLARMRAGLATTDQPGGSSTTTENV